MPASRSGHAHLGDVSIYYEIDGTGHPLVLIHGWTLNLRMWDAQVPPLAARYCVVRYDRRGFGQSSGDPAPERDADDLNALLSYLELPSAYVLGMSQGGWAALYLGLDHPERTDALILNAALLPGFSPPFAGADRVPGDRYAELARTHGMAAMREAWLDHPFFEVARARPEVASRLQAIVAGYSGVDLGKVKTPVFGDARDAVHRLGRLNVRTLVLIGERDVPYMRLVAQAQAYGIRNSTLVILPGCGHMAAMEDPDAYNAALLRFLEDADRSRSARPGV